MILKKICTFLCIPCFLLCVASIFLFVSCNQERQNELAEKRCNEIPCSKASCFFWNPDEHRCVTDDGLKEIKKHKNGGDSLFVQEYLRNLLDKQIELAHNEYEKKRKKTIEILMNVQKKSKINSTLLNQIQIYSRELSKDSVLYKKLTKQRDSLLMDLNDSLSIYKK